MPVRSLTSSVLKWPDAQVVYLPVREWAAGLVRRRPEVIRIGYFGSYARGDWGVGSDLDIVIVVGQSHIPFVRRALEWNPSELPVPADVLVYTEAERVSLQGRFPQSLRQDTIWVYDRTRDGAGRTHISPPRPAG